MQAVVTTTALLKHWLREHREDGLPQEIAAAFKSDRFYYQAIQELGLRQICRAADHEARIRECRGRRARRARQRRPEGRAA